MATIGEKIAAERKKRGWSQEKLGAQVGWSHQSIRDVEKGAARKSGAPGALEDILAFFHWDNEGNPLAAREVPLPAGWDERGTPPIVVRLVLLWCHIEKRDRKKLARVIEPFLEDAEERAEYPERAWLVWRKLGKAS